MQLQRGDILLVHGDGIVAVGIEIVTNSPFCHAAIIVDDTQVIEAQGGRDVGFAPLSGYAGNGLVLRVPNLTEEQRDNVIEFAKAQFGTPYDYEAIFKELARYEFHKSMQPEDGRFICSSLIAACYYSIGIKLTDAVIASPDDLYRSTAVEIAGRY